MSDLFVPPSLNDLGSLPKLADSLQKLFDPAERKKLEADIKILHALNQSESQKADEARTLIKQNLNAVEDAKKITTQNMADKDALKAERLAFAEEKRQEYQKISDAKLPTSEALTRAQELRDEAAALQKNISEREKALEEDKKKHALDAAQLTADLADLAEEKKQVEEYKKSVMELDQTTKQKVEALKKFNF